MRRIAAAALMAVCILIGCGEKTSAYRSVSQSEAMAMMESETDYVILDVRRPDEFETKHIPGAVNIPNETITDTMPAELDDLSQLIFVYCRSGNRSRQAAQKLAGMGYTNIVEIGGIETWPGEITEGKEIQEALTKNDLILDGCTPGETDGITLTAESFACPNLEMVLTNQSGSTFAYGSAFTLEINDNGEWKETEQSRQMMWTKEAYELPDGESIRLSADLSRLAEPLVPGRYRIGKAGIYAGFRLVYTE